MNDDKLCNAPGVAVHYTGTPTAAYSHASELRTEKVRQIATLRVRRPSLLTVLFLYPTAPVSLQ